jgi:MGT family glycosyltransferase
MRARFLFTCWPFAGHVLPQVSIATALRDRGHDVAFYTGASARPTIASGGFPIFPFTRLDEHRAQRNVAMLEHRDQRARPSPLLLRRTFRDWLVETIPDQVADLEPLLDLWQPDVVVTDLAFWAPIVILWEKIPIPVALFPTFMGPLLPGPDAPPWGLGLAPPRNGPARLMAAGVSRTTEWVGTGLRRRVDEIRAEHRLGPLGCSVNQFTGRLPLILVGSIPELDYRRRDLPPSVHYVGECAWHPPDDSMTAAWLEALPTKRPWVHVTEGTLHSGDPFILRAAVRGLAGAQVEAILTTGGQRDPEGLSLGDLADNIHLTRWASHAQLLPRCSAVVTAGGAATIVSALRSGVPLVVVPTTWDKPDNARRVVEAGVGVRVAPRRCTPETLRAAVDQVLNEANFRANARRIAERLAGARGPSGAAELLEGIAHHGARTLLSDRGDRR